MVTAMARPSTRALSVDVELIRLLAEGAVEGSVHSVFRRVVNVMTPGGQLISMCGRGLDDAPWSLRADVDDWTACNIEPGGVVSADGDAVTVHGGGPRVDLALAQTWTAAAVPITADPPQLTDRAHRLADVIRIAGVPGGAVAGLAPDRFAALVVERIARGLADIVTAELAGNAADLEAAASSLLGLGPGLTPAGDDALTGLALVVAQPGSLATTVLPALRRVLQRQTEGTTELSRATLWAALDGRGRQRLLDLVDTLVSHQDPAPPLLREHVGRVIGIGHTSGTDIACGVLAGIELEIQRRGSACLSPQ
jgi:hypothetical protein